MPDRSLSPDELRLIDAWWRAANYLSVGQIFLFDNPLLKRPLAPDDVKRMLLGHWGTTPGQNFIYAHLNRVIVKYDLDMIFISGPGHGGPAVVANTYLEGSYSEIYPDITRDEAGLQEAVPAVFVSRRHSEPRIARVSRLDSRRRRAGLFAQPCLRRGLRQSRAHRRLRGGRRRSGDRSAGDGVAFQQVPGSSAPMARCCPSCISTATRSPTRLCWRAFRARSSSSCCAATAGRRISSAATSRR